MFIHRLFDYGCLYVPIYSISHHHVRLCRVLYICFSLLSKHTCTRLDVLCILLYMVWQVLFGYKTLFFLPCTLGYVGCQYSLDESTQFCCIPSRYNPALLVLCGILGGQGDITILINHFAKIAVFGEPFNFKVSKLLVKH